MSNRPLLWSLVVSCLFLVAIAACGAPASTATPTPTPTNPSGDPNEGTPQARDMDAYFSGRTVEIIVGSAPGGGYDFFARAFALHAPKYFPEGTRFVVQNLPGSGQLLGAQATWRANPDGYTAGLIHSRWYQAAVLGEDVPGLDLNDPTRVIVGSPTSGATAHFICVDTRYARSWEDVLAASQPLTVGEVAPGSPSTIGASWLEYIGAPVRMVYGYGGSSEALAAFDRGELRGIGHCREGYLPRLYPEWIEQGRVLPLFWWSEYPIQEYLEQLGVEGELPHIFDLPGIEYTEAQRDAFEAADLLLSIQRVFELPPGTPQDIATYWQERFREVVNDPEFVETVVVGGYGDDLNYAGPEEVQAAIERSLQLSDEAKAIVRDLVGEGS